MSTFTTKRTLNFDESLFMNFSSEILKGRIDVYGTNPEGRCCLGNVRRLLRGQDGGPDCCGD